MDDTPALVWRVLWLLQVLAGSIIFSNVFDDPMTQRGKQQSRPPRRPSKTSSSVPAASAPVEDAETSVLVLKQDNAVASPTEVTQVHDNQRVSQFIANLPDPNPTHRAQPSGHFQHATLQESSAASASPNEATHVGEGPAPMARAIAARSVKPAQSPKAPKPFPSTKDYLQPTSLAEASSSFASANEATHVGDAASLMRPSPNISSVPKRPNPFNAQEPTHVGDVVHVGVHLPDFASERTDVSGKHDFITKSFAKKEPPTEPNRKALEEQLEQTNKLPALGGGVDEFIKPMSAEDVSLAFEVTNKDLPVVGSNQPLQIQGQRGSLSVDPQDPYKSTLSPSSLTPLYQPAPVDDIFETHDLQAPKLTPYSESPTSSALQVPIHHDPVPLDIPIKVEDSEWGDVIRQETNAKIDISAMQRQMFMASALGDPVAAFEAEQSRIMQDALATRGSRWPQDGPAPDAMKMVYASWSAAFGSLCTLALGVLIVGVTGKTLSWAAPMLIPMLLVAGALCAVLGHKKTRELEHKMKQIGLLPSSSSGAL